MLSISNDTNVYFKIGATDMRKSFNSLTALVQTAMHLDPYSKSVFVFCNKWKRILKILYWDKNGFCLWIKRLETDKFKWPKDSNDVLSISAEQLSWFLNGLDFTKAYKPLQYENVC
jgi:transposase